MAHMACTRALTLTLGLLSLYAPVAVAQTPPVTWRVTVTRIKPEMRNEWLDLQKNEVVPALKKGGVANRTVFASTAFGDTYEYTIVQPMGKFAEFDSPSSAAKVLGPEAFNRLAEKLRRCVDSSQSFMATRVDELSNLIPGAKPPAVVTYLRVRVAPGKMQEVRNLFKAEVLPIFKKQNVGLTVTQRGIGADSNDLSFSSAYAKFADLDSGGPLRVELGAEGEAKLRAKFASLVTTMENIVRTRVADLSF